MAIEIRFFREHRKEYGYLSNFYPSPIRVNGHGYATVEHFYQASKALLPEDHSRIAQAATPAEAKRHGRQIALRPDWDEIKEGIMYQGLKAKFENFPDLLLKTGNVVLIEDSPFDPYWGTGRTGNGKNRLGKLLMRLRDELAETRKRERREKR